MLKTVLLTSLVLLVPIIGARTLGWFESSELATYDNFIERRPKETPDDRVVVVTISDEDIEELQQFPIHDGTLATALAKLESYQPWAIGLDIARDVPQGPPAGRKQLADVIGKSQVIVSGCLLSTENHPGSPPAPGTPEGGAAFADFPTDVDKSVRRARLISVPGKPNKKPRTNHTCNDASPDNEIPSLSFQLALMYLAGSNINPDAAARNEVQFGKQILHKIDPQFGGYRHAEVNDYQMMLNYRGSHQVFKEISLLDVLKNKVRPDQIRDRVVLIGYTSEVSKDSLSTPYRETQSGSRLMYGVVVHAHAVSQILSAVLDQRPLIRSWSDLSEMAWIVGWALGGGILAFYSRRLGLFLLVVVGSSSALIGLCYWLFVYQGLWIPLSPALTALLLTAFGVRLLDLATRSGYAQAIYDQLRDQWQRGGNDRDRRGDYLESLVLRARATRQGQAAAELASQGGQLDPTASPEMKALYEQITARVKQDMVAEQSAQMAAMTRRGGNKANRMQALLNRAQRSRSETPAKPASRVAGNSPEVPHE